MEQRDTIARDADAANRRSSDSSWHNAFAIDVRSLAAVRIGAGIVLLWDLISRSRFLTEFYTDVGVTPRSLFIEPSDPWRSFYFLVGSRAGVMTLLAFHAVFAAMLSLGLFTRLATFACVLFTWSLVNRNIFITHGGDALLLWVLIWLLFLPADAVISLDQLRRNRKGRGSFASTSFCSPASAALLLQVVLLYWGAVAGRFAYREWWSSLTAVHYFLHSYNATPLGQRLADNSTLTTIATAGTMLWELLAPPLALASYRLPRVRTTLIALFILLHFTMGRLFYLGTFEAVCMVAWLAFVPGWMWGRLGWNPNRDDRQATQSSWRWPRSRLAAVIASLVLIYVLVINVVNDIPATWARRLGPIASLPKLKQWWVLMSRPMHREDRLITEAILEDGNTVVFDPPQDSSSGWSMLFPPGDVRVGRYRRTILEANNTQRARLLEPYCQWHRSQWDASHRSEQRVQEVTINLETVTLPAFGADEILVGFPMQSTQRRFALFNWPAPQPPKQ